MVKNGELINAISEVKPTARSYNSKLLFPNTFDRDGIKSKLVTESRLLIYSVTHKYKSNYDKFPLVQISEKEAIISGWEEIISK